MPQQIEVCERLDTIRADEWNALIDADQPFMRHEFLSALERNGCVGEHWGWVPRHLVLRDASGRLTGAAPLYLKFNSYGEFVFDHAWADAYQRHGLRYYPKLVGAVPYTPVSGLRLLATPGQEQRVWTRLEQGARELAERERLSSLHWLFTPPEQSDWLHQRGYMRRLGCQFHWHNPGHADFDAYLATMTAKKRKNIRRERRQVREAGISFRVLRGDQADADDWEHFHHFYRSTFERKGGAATLSLDFFHDIASHIGRHLLIVFAQRGPRPIAAAFSLIGTRSLYGRHWGCEESYRGLHFETCYYQGLDYCMARRLQRFEPGAQGEHKISRGFTPTRTWSAHWLRETAFRDAVAHFLELETEGMEDYMKELSSHSPFRHES